MVYAVCVWMMAKLCSVSTPRVGNHLVYLLRCLVNNEFVALLPPDVEVDGEELHSAMPELPNVSFGKVGVLGLLPAESTDSGLQRAVF